MKMDCRLFLKDMLETMEAIESFVGEMDYEDFVENDLSEKCGCEEIRNYW